jgi:Flp pilus assembly CpaF family ATPase
MRTSTDFERAAACLRADLGVSRSLIRINEPTKVFIARAGLQELTTTVLSEDQFHDLVEKMLKSSGHRVDLSAPFADSMLPDGSTWSFRILPAVFGR